jgi:hypothetical protein
MPIIDYYLNTWEYFTSLNDSPFEGSLLDYGSNYGLFLHSSNGSFIQTNYTGIDIDIAAIEEGQKLFPKAKFIHYDRYNIMYNVKGKKDVWPVLTEQFDNIVSYSVLTHTTIEDTLSTIEWLYDHLKPKKKMFLTWLDIENNKALEYFQKKRIKDFGNCDVIQTTDYVYVVDNKVTKIPEEGMFLVFYKQAYLKNLLSKYNCKFTQSPTPLTGCFQDCLIITKE